MKEPQEQIKQLVNDNPDNTFAGLVPLYYAIWNAAVEACAESAYNAKTDKEAQHSILKLLIK